MENRYNEESQNFLKAMRILNKYSDSIDEERKFFFDAWYKIIHTECSKKYSIDKIRQLKKNLINDLQKQTEELKEEEKIGFDYAIQVIYQANQARIESLSKKIQYIQKADEDEILNIIVQSLFLTDEQVEALKKEKSLREQRKLKNLSYKGKSCVDEDDSINEEIAKKIYNEIENNPDLLYITERVSEGQKTNSLFVNLQTAKQNAKSIVYSNIIEIYDEKIQKIKSEIKEELKKISKTKYSNYIDSNNLNLTRLKTTIEEDYEKSKSIINKIFSISREEKLKELLSMINGTLEHEKTKEDFCERLEVYNFEEPVLEIYECSKTAQELREKKMEILEQTGVIINNLGEDIITLHIGDFVKEINQKTIELNEQITELATREEHKRIEAFAKKLGMTIENALKLLKDEECIYTCLYTFIFGNEIEKEIEIPGQAQTILDKLDPRFKEKKQYIDNRLRDNLNTKENTTPLTIQKTKVLKLPNKNK